MRRFWSVRHRHACSGGCGDFYMCSQAPDQCPTDWQCPRCADDQLADHLHSLTHSHKDVSHEKR